MECPISHEPINYYAFTVNGSVFDLENIVKWFAMGNITDPLTNEPLQSTKVVLFGNSSTKTIEEVETKQKHLRETYSIWSGQWFFNKSKQENKKNIKLISSLYKKILLESPEIVNSQNEKARKFVVSERCHFLEPIEFVFKDFQCLNLTKLVVVDKSFKKRKFAMADLSDSLFVSCNFSRCDFSMAIMKNTKFYMCNFIGEETDFEGVINSNIHFYHCIIEPIGNWDKVESTSNLFFKILKKRGLKN